MIANKNEAEGRRGPSPGEREDRTVRNSSTSLDAEPNTHVRTHTTPSR